MKICLKLLPVKAHYFFFMASMGPILPQLSVYGKQLGVSPVVMGTVTGILPIMFVIAKPIFGFLVDKYRTYRKQIFLSIIIAMGLLYSGLYFVPFQNNTWHLIGEDCRNAISEENTCNGSHNMEVYQCHLLQCTLTYGNNKTQQYLGLPNLQSGNICLMNTDIGRNYSSALDLDAKTNCNLFCEDDVEKSTECTLASIRFWSFVFLMSAGTIGYNVINSISDAICFDVLGEGEQMLYGKQRVWGTIGFGISALLSGFVVDWWSVGNIKSFEPALVIMMAFLSLDVICCQKLQLPPMETPKNIIKDIGKLLKFLHIRIFIVFATLAGVVDSFIIYFFFWYLEELAADTGYMRHIKLLEGIIVAAETLVGEVIFFSVSGSILRTIGYGHSLSMCFVFYALRLALISTIPSPWWAIPIELFLQGPTYAMCYTTIVAYASAISPPGTSATMQGFVAGMDDGFGYAIGSTLGGILYRKLGGRGALYVFSAMALACGITHAILYRTVLKHRIPSTTDDGYQDPHSALKNMDNNDS